MTVLVDSNIFIDHLNEVTEATRFLAETDDIALSVISQIEVLSGVRESEEAIVRAFLASFTMIGLSERIADVAVVVRRERRLRLPDALILATARHLGCQLVTRNTKDFDASDAEIVVPYTL